MSLDDNGNRADSFDWMRVKSVHVPSVQNLYHQIVPPLLQPVEPQPKECIGLDVQ